MQPDISKNKKYTALHIAGHIAIHYCVFTTYVDSAQGMLLISELTKELSCLGVAKSR